jgi:hypothetical protein
MREPMSTNGNGTEPRRVQLTPEWLVPENKPLSATEREQQRVAYIAAVDAMAVTLRLTAAQVEALRTAVTNALRGCDDHASRLDAIERAAAVDRSRTRWQRMRWLVGL